jgi:hypothetical protein
MLMIFAYSYPQADQFLSDLKKVKPEIRTWKRGKDFKVVTENHKRAYRGYMCDIVFLRDWTERVRNFEWLDVQEDLEIRLHIGDFTDKTEEYLKLIQ